MIIFWVLVLIHLGMTIWVFVDARKNTPTAWLWGFATLLASLPLLLTYLAVQPLYQAVDRYGVRIYELESAARNRPGV